MALSMPASLAYPAHADDVDPDRLAGRMIRFRVRLRVRVLADTGAHRSVIARDVRAYRALLESNRAAWRRVLRAYNDPHSPRPTAAELAAYFSTCAVNGGTT